MSKSIQIVVSGSGYVGLVAAVCFAEMGHDVICVDNDKRKVAALQGGDTLIHENFLPELLQRHRNTRVRFMISGHRNPPKPIAFPCAPRQVWRRFSAKSLMQIPSHVIGLDVVPQLSIFPIDTKALPAPL